MANGEEERDERGFLRRGFDRMMSGPGSTAMANLGSAIPGGNIPQMARAGLQLFSPEGREGVRTGLNAVNPLSALGVTDFLSRGITLPRMEYGDMPGFLQDSSRNLAFDVGGGQFREGGDVVANTANLPPMRSTPYSRAMARTPDFPSPQVRDIPPAESAAENVANQITRYASLTPEYQQAMQNYAIGESQRTGAQAAMDLYGQMMGEQNIMQLFMERPELFQPMQITNTASPGAISGRVRSFTTAGPAPIEMMLPWYSQGGVQAGAQDTTRQKLFTEGYVPLEQAEAQYRSALELAPFSAVPKTQARAGTGFPDILKEAVGNLSAEELSAMLPTLEAYFRPPQEPQLTQGEDGSQGFIDPQTGSYVPMTAEQAARYRARKAAEAQQAGGRTTGVEEEEIY